MSLNISYADVLKNIVKNDSMLSNGITGFIQYNDKKYLIAVGIVGIDNSSIQEKINAIKSARVKAKVNLSNFINNTQVQSLEQLTSIVTVISNGDKYTRVSKEEYIEIIKEKGNGLLRDITDIGEWRIDKEYFYALGGGEFE